ncbi:uncharacterized protein LOC120293764 [Eucalyptus grandis]|uniref:uncharacterized protein LOC120293764 n=1 Tax=Eucalyptus grandis TaxID=71139 RepID=UPI00192EC9BD|nr:uncharacterized protein LOC120293764 [Eucalyptus grandis]
MGTRLEQQAITIKAAAQAAVTAAIAPAAESAAATALAVTPTVALAAMNVESPLGIVVVARPIHKLVEQFLKLNPPLFTGTGNPEAASLWVQKLEKVFALLMCNETEKVVLIAYQLEEVANTWWMTTQETIFPEGVVQEWKIFLEAFNDKYFSETTREVKIAKFQRLR